jgi:hypothetical protein
MEMKRVVLVVSAPTEVKRKREGVLPDDGFDILRMGHDCCVSVWTVSSHPHVLGVLVFLEWSAETAKDEIRTQREPTNETSERDNERTAGAGIHHSHAQRFSLQQKQTKEITNNNSSM